MFGAAMAGCFQFCVELFSSWRASRRGTLQQYSSKWALLPPELLRLVASRLPISDHLRLGAVCTPWSHALRDTSRFLREGRPWLMLNHYGVDDHKLSLVHLPEGQSFHLPLLPEVAGRVWCVGYKDGWLVVLHQLTILLLNPLTRRQVSFPSFYAQPGTDHTSAPCVFKIVVSATPTTAKDGSIIALAVTSDKNIAYADLTDRNWTPIQVDPNNEVRDIAYHDGEFCILCSGPRALDSEGMYRRSQLTMLSFHGSLVSTFEYEYVDRLEEGTLSLVSSPTTGDLLQVLGMRDRRDGTEYRKFVVMVFSSKHASYWAVVENLGSQSLFLDLLQFTSFPTAGFAGMRGNCVYSAKATIDHSNDLTIGMEVFDIGRGTREPCPTSSWGLEHMVSVFPFWFKPSLC